MNRIGLDGCVALGSGVQGAGLVAGQLLRSDAGAVSSHRGADRTRPAGEVSFTMAAVCDLSGGRATG